VGVWIGHSPHNTIAHNDIFDFYYTGVSVGWIWGYHPSHAQHNDIGFNHIHTIGQGVLSDMGGIYTLGPSHGTVLHDNHIHDVRSLDYGGWGLYTDEGSHAIRLANNLVYRTKSGGFHQHYGSENVVENNIFAFGERQQIERTRVEPHLSYTFRRNIVYWTRGPLVQGNWTDGVRQEQNLYWAIEGGDKLFPGGRTLAQWQQTGRDQGSKVADPGFANPQGGDFHLDPGSPAIALGFKPFDYTQAGRRGAAVLTKDLPPAPRGFE
jgi:hypothetical protein